MPQFSFWAIHLILPGDPPQQESPPFTAKLNASRCPSWLPPAQVGLALVVPLSDLLDPNLPLQAFCFFGLLLYQLFVGVPNVLWLVKAPRGVVFALGRIGVPLAVPLAINVERALANTGLQKCNCYTKKKRRALLVRRALLIRQDAVVVQAPTRSDVGVQVLARLAISHIHLGHISLVWVLRRIFVLLPVIILLPPLLAPSPVACQA